MASPARLVIDIITNARGVDRGVDQATSRLGKLGKVGAAAGAAVAGGLVAAGAGALAFVGSSVGAASSLEQSFGALESVYGKNADAVKAWAKDAAGSVGLSAQAYAELSAQVGSQLQGMGVAQAESAKQTDELVRVGADLAATFGGSVSDAVGAVGSLLRGERDPIERYGVSIKAADVEAQLAAQGLGHLTGAAKDQAAAQATLTLLMDKTKNASGAFGRESNTLAGQQERLRAKFENVKASVGAGLLPILTRLATFVSDTVLPAASRLGREVGDRLRPAFEAVRRAVAQNRPELEQLGRIGAQLGKVLGGVVVLSLQHTFRVLAGGVRAVGTMVRLFGELYDRIRAVGRAISSNPLGKAVGGVLGAVFGGPELATGSPALTGVYGYGGVAGLATAALSGGGSYSGGSLSGGGLAVVDRRSFPTTIRVEGALDAPAVARQLERLLDEHALRLGRATSWGRA